MPKKLPGILAALVLTASVSLGGCGTSADAMPDTPRPTVMRSTAAHPVVVELYQSQGCSSCPPANAYLNGIADRSDVLALSFAVTYWDRLGWKDTFGSPQFTRRQQDYAGAGRGQVATPEIIINGTQAVVGANTPAFNAAIARAGAASGGPDIGVGGGTVRLGKARALSPSKVWLVRYDPRSRNVPIRAGENGDRTLPHRNIVRDLVALGSWAGETTTYRLPPNREAGLVSAILVQSGVGGPIISARKI